MASFGEMPAWPSSYSRLSTPQMPTPCSKQQCRQLNPGFRYVNVQQHGW